MSNHSYRANQVIGSSREGVEAAIKPIRNESRCPKRGEAGRKNSVLQVIWHRGELAASHSPRAATHRG